MSETTIALIGGGAGIGGVVLGGYLGARSERQNRQLEMIMDIYRPLIEDLRTRALLPERLRPERRRKFKAYASDKETTPRGPRAHAGWQCLRCSGVSVYVPT